MPEEADAIFVFCSPQSVFDADSDWSSLRDTPAAPLTAVDTTSTSESLLVPNSGIATVHPTFATAIVVPTQV